MAAVLQSSGSERERNKLRNRELILAAARDCFLRMGYGAVSVRDIIGNTPLASGTFYNYFPDKAAVFRALIEDRIGEMNEHLHEARSSAMSLQEFLYGAYLNVFRFMDMDPVFFAFIFRTDPVVREFYEVSVFGMLAKGIREDVQDAIERGLIPPCDVEYLVAAFYGVGYEMGRSLLMREPRDVEAAAQMATRLLLGGVAALASPE